jgi:hypothetical protein
MPWHNLSPLKGRANKYVTHFFTLKNKMFTKWVRNPTKPKWTFFFQNV